MESNESAKDPNIDGGYAWIILASGTVMYMIIAGTSKTFGVLYTEMLVYYGAGAGSTAWIGSLPMLLMFGMGPFSNWLSVKYTFREVSFVGGVLVGVGYSLSFFVEKMEIMYLTFGVLAGVGYGLSFSPCSTIISFYFKKYRALANGVLVSGSGVGVVVVPFLYEYLIKAYGLRGALLIVGALSSHVSVAACFLVQPESLRAQKQNENQTVSRRNEHESQVEETAIDQKCNSAASTQNQTKTSKSSCGPDFKLAKLRNPRFLLYAASFFFWACGFMANLLVIPPHVRALGQSQQKVVICVSIMGGCELVTRIFFGWFADKQFIKEKHIYIVSMLISAVFAFITPAFNSFEYMAVYASVVGIFPGTFWSLVAVLVIDVVGMEDFTGAIGLVLLSVGVAAVFGQEMVGFLADKTGNWHTSFYFIGIMMLVSGVLFMLEPVLNRFCGERKQSQYSDVVVDVTTKRGKHSASPLQDTNRLLDEENYGSFYEAEK